MLIDWPRLHLPNIGLLVVTKELEIQVIPVGIGWTIPITFYLKNGTLLEDYKVSQRLKVWATRIRGVMYQWPTMQKDAQSYVKAYDKCQRFSKTSWLNTTKGSRRAPNPHPNGMDRQQRVLTIKDANDTWFSSKARSSYIQVERRTKLLKSALVRILSLPTYGRTDEPSHPKVPWSKLKSYLQVEGWTKPLMGALVKI